MTDLDRILSEAASWHVACARDDMDWDAFTAWLEADPRHARAYHELALADSLLGEHRPVLVAMAAAEPDNSTVVPFAPRRRWMIGAVVAAAAAALAVVVVPSLRPKSDIIYRTGGAARSIALADGSAIELAPRSRLTLEHGDEARLALEGGAFFDIRHDPARTMRIVAGPATIQDIGTRFDVQTTPQTVRVGVVEGHVDVVSDSLAQPVVLHAGQGLSFDAAAHSATVRTEAASVIGVWRSGRLSYQDAPLALVASDLGRYAGISVKVANGLEDERFSGTLVVSDGQAAVRDLSQLMGLALDRDAGGYRLDPARH
ncbi:MAG: FecR domain-containing protein [Sphingomonadales bacterium]|nr:FecR domain-containing protein [Sphingomonadales bacterium]MDE2567544.1 FecR domain-containing protein [Sphingomonadales bacterium]